MGHYLQWKDLNLRYSSCLLSLHDTIPMQCQMITNRKSITYEWLISVCDPYYGFLSTIWNHLERLTEIDS